MRLSNGPAPIKSAILATDSTIIRYGKLHALLIRFAHSTFAFSKIDKKPHNGSALHSNY